MTEEERLAFERMTAAYKAQEAARRLPMVAAAELGPGDLDEYAHLNQAQPPLEGRQRMPAQTVPMGPYPPVRAPSWFDPRTAPPIPSGYTYGDDQITRDPVGVPATVQSPARSELAWDALTGALPSVGIGSAMAAVKGVGTGNKYAESILDMVKDYRDSVGRHVRQQQEPPDPSVPEIPASRSHGGSLVSGVIEGLRQMYEHPGNVHQGKADPYDPAQAFNFATTMMTGGVAGVPRAAGEVAIGAGPIRPGTWYHPITENKLRVPLEEMSATHVPTGQMKPRQIVTPSELEGQWFTSVPGDRTAAGSKLTAVNERPLAHEVTMQGGPGYMLANDALWASQQGAANTLQGRINKLAEETGQKPLAAFAAMSHTGGDYSHMPTDVLLGMLPSSKISQKNIAKFRAEMKDRGYPIPPFSTDNIDALRTYLLGRESGRAREAFVQTMATKPFQEARFPDVGSARKATIEPALLHEPGLSSGYMIGRTAPGQPTVTNPAQHMTYSTQIPGEAIGGFEFPLQKDKMWLDYYRGRVREGKNIQSSNEDYAFRLKGPSQKATPEWVDTAEEEMRRRREQAR